MVINPLPNDTFLDLYKLTAYADDKINVTKNQKLFLKGVENTVGKEENAGYALQGYLFLIKNTYSRSIILLAQ